MVGLQLCLVQRFDAQYLDLGAKLVDVLVEESEVEELVEVGLHVLEAELVIKVAPRERLGVVSVDRRILQVLKVTAWLLLLQDVVF